MTIRDMLFTPSSSDSLPLIPSTPISSSCSMSERLIIQRSPCQSASFTWTDFPVVANDSFFPFMSACDADSADSSSDVSMEDASSCSSFATSEQLSSSSSSSASSSRRRVKFAPMLEVRTHAITLGDHPCCTELPVELGWEHAETQFVDLEHHEMKRAYHTKPRKLSYLERKQLLQEFVDEETMQSTLQQQPHLKRGGLSSFQLVAMA